MKFLFVCGVYVLHPNHRQSNQIFQICREIAISKCCSRGERDEMHGSEIKKKKSVITIIPFPLFKFISADMNRIKVQLNVHTGNGALLYAHKNTIRRFMISYDMKFGTTTIAMNRIDWHWYALFVLFYQMRQMFTIACSHSKLLFVADFASVFKTFPSLLTLYHQNFKNICIAYLTLSHFSLKLFFSYVHTFVFYIFKDRNTNVEHFNGCGLSSFIRSKC